MEKVILTGGSGFIGEHVINDLISRGIHVTVLTSNRNYNNDSLLVDIIYTSYDYDEIIKKCKEKRTMYFIIWDGEELMEVRRIIFSYRLATFRRL